MRKTAIIMAIMASAALLSGCGGKGTRGNGETDAVPVDMVFVKGGTFDMGCTEEHENYCGEGRIVNYPVRSADVGDFYIGRYEVTQGLWKAVMGDNPSEFTGNDSLPVENVRWYDTKEFIGKLNDMTGKRYRLPTEEEWEYAARGGHKSRGYLYSGGRKIDSIAWYSKNSGKKTHPVGTKQPNELGIHDMNGNVYEWVEDCYERGYCHLRVVRGGGWGSSDNEQFYVFHRGRLNSISKANFVGLRLAHGIDSGRGMVPRPEEKTPPAAEKESAKDNGIYKQDGYRHLDPQYFSTGETTNKWIFPVPEPNAVGTLDGRNNGITFINFDDYATGNEFRVVAKDYGERIYSLFKYRFCPNYTDEMIVYSQNRVAVIANVKTGEAFYTECSLSMNDFMLGIRFLDPQKNLFAVVKAMSRRPGWEYYLHVMKLEGKQLINTDWSMPMGKTRYLSDDIIPLYYNWFVHDRKLFAYNEDGKILCTDGYQDVPHPFSEVFNAHADGIGNVKDIAIHSALPFGVAIEDYHMDSKVLHQLRIVRWEAKQPEEQLVSLNTVFEPLAELFDLKNAALAYQSFSPDGSWYVLGFLEREAAQSTIKPRHPFFIAIPVDKENKDFLAVDKLVVLGQVSNMTSIAWASGPSAYVVSNGKRLRKWDLPDR